MKKKAEEKKRSQLNEKNKTEIRELGKGVNWRKVEERAEGEEKFFVEGEGLHLIKNLLRVDEGTVIGFYGYLEKMIETLIGEIIAGKIEGVLRRGGGERGGTRVKECFKKAFKRKHEDVRERLRGGWDYMYPEAFWVLMKECFEWKWGRIMGRKIKLGFLKKKIDRAKMKMWERIEVFLKPEIPQRLFLPGDKDEEMVRKKMLEAGVEKELVEKILDGKLGKTETASELVRRGAPGEVIDRLIIREEYLDGLKELYRVKRDSGNI